MNFRRDAPTFLDVFYVVALVAVLLVVDVFYIGHKHSNELKKMSSLHNEEMMEMHGRFQEQVWIFIVLEILLVFFMIFSLPQMWKYFSGEKGEPSTPRNSGPEKEWPRKVEPKIKGSHIQRNRQSCECKKKYVICLKSRKRIFGIFDSH